MADRFRAGKQSDRIDVVQDTAARQQAVIEELEKERDGARDEAVLQRAGAEHARTELAKAELRLEGMPRLERELLACREAFEAEHAARIAAEQVSAVATAQKSGLAERWAEDKVRIDELGVQLRRTQDLYAEAAAQLAESRLAVEFANSRLAAADRELSIRGKRM